MFNKEKEYDNPQFEIVVINSVDIITVSPEDYEEEIGGILGF